MLCSRSSEHLESLEAENFKNVYLPWFNKTSSRGSIGHKIFIHHVSKRESTKHNTVTLSQCLEEQKLDSKDTTFVRRGQLTRPNTSSSITLAQTMQLPWVLYETPGSGPAVLLLTSAMESLIKYAEIIHSLVDKSNCSVYAIELRSQGFSSRSLEPEKTHVDSFEEYYNDLLAFIDNVVYPHMDMVNRRREELSVMGFGIGALIATQLATEYEQPFKRMILVSPFFGRPKPGLKKLLKRGLRRKSKKPPHQVVAKKNQFSQEATGSGSRQKIWQQLKEELDIETQPTNKWHAALLAAYLNKSHLALAHEAVPTLVITGGADLRIGLSHVKDFVKRAPLCNHTHFPDGSHDIFFDSADQSKRAMAKATQFLKEDFTPTTIMKSSSSGYGWGDRSISLEPSTYVGSW